MKVTWNQDACCHSGNCVNTLPEVFSIENGQFVIRADNGSDADINAAIAACPGKALRGAPDDAA